ncbi:MAG: hypothetical protein ACP5KN_11200 [Armatimonadota bacterium]
MQCRLRTLTAIIVLLLGTYLFGCGGAADLLAYTGGGLPPGEPDVGGIVLAQLPSATELQTAQATVPVVGAEVELLQGNRVVGRAITGQGGYFRFERPRSGSYAVHVTPPAGSGLRPAERQFRHRFGQQTFLEIVLHPEAD